MSGSHYTLYTESAGQADAATCGFAPSRTAEYVGDTGIEPVTSPV